MFSRILHYSAIFLFPYNVPSESVASSQVHQQIQVELEQAAKQGMVSTRSQVTTPAGDASKSSKVLYPQVVVREKKRKIDNEGGDSPAQVVAKKRRRSAKLNGDSAPPSSASKRGRPRKRASTNTADGDAAYAIAHNISNHEPLTQGSRPTSPQTPGLTTDPTLHDDQVDKAIEVAFKKPRDTQVLDDEVLDSHAQVRLDAEGATKPRTGRILKKREKDSDGIASVDEDGADVGSNGKKPDSSFIAVAKATHKRFGSEDIEVLATVSSTGIEQREEGQEDLSEDESRSEDEAPDIVTASAGFDNARTSTVEAAKVATMQKAEKKLKRRKHDQRLRLQAESAKDSRSNDELSTKKRRRKGSSTKVIEADGQISDERSEFLGEYPKTIKDGNQKAPAKSKVSGKTPLPPLLPEEILAAQPVIPTSTPPSSKSKEAISQKRRLLEVEPKPPKDIKRGNVIISVLPDSRSILPPRSSQASKALRESWLAGRPGLKGKICVPRQKPSSGFLRRKG